MLDSHSVAKPDVVFFICRDCLACPQRGFAPKFVPSSEMEPQMRQGMGSALVLAVTPCGVGILTCTLLSLSRRRAGLRLQRQKRTVIISQGALSLRVLIQ